MRTAVQKYLMLLLLTALLSACGPQQNRVRVDQSEDMLAAIHAFESGDYHSAAPVLTDYFERHPDASEMGLMALQSWIEQDVPERAWLLLNEHPALGVLPQSQLLKVRLHLQAGDVLMALDALRAVDVNELPLAWQSPYFRLRIEANEAIGDDLEVALAAIEMDRHDPMMAAEYRDQMINALINVSDDALLQAMDDSALTPVQLGWLEAAYIDFGIEKESADYWFERWGDHPAGRYFLDSNSIREYQNIAVLLPLTGQFAHVGHAIQQGLLAAAFEVLNPRAELRFLDTGSNGEFFSTAWYSALEQGADFIIGPVDKASLDKLAMTPEATVPVMVLNRHESLLNYYQFSLSPENEAAEVAEYMHRQGVHRAMVVSPRSDWGSRVANAFANRFVQLGGRIESAAFYFEQENDHTGILRQSLGLIQSQLRAQSLQSLLQRPLRSEEIINPQIDAIFLAARAEKARLIIPQLKFNRAGDVPVYSTSHVYSGTDDPAQDKDLNGVVFGTSPLLLQPPRLINRLSFNAQQVNVDRRLFALGYDALSLIPRLGWMHMFNKGRIQALSGDLEMREDLSIYRHLSWAQFSHGQIQPARAE